MFVFLIVAFVGRVWVKTVGVPSLRSNSPRVLTYGLDAILLTTRKLVLEHLQIQVDGAASREDFESCVKNQDPQYALYVLCHTVPDEERQSIRGLANGSHTPVYEVAPLIPPRKFLGRVAAVLGEASSL